MSDEIDDTLFHDQAPPNLTDAQKYRRRLRKQAGYQGEYRARLRRLRIPERDDVAKALIAFCVDCWAYWPEATPKLRNGLLDTLAKAGFNRARSEDVLDGMIERRRQKIEKESY